jgi:sulfofructose kinase
LTPTFDVLGFGAIAVDDLLYVDHYPPADAKMPVTDIARQGGGLTATALVAVTRLGGTAAYAGVLGDDELSRHAMAALEEEGVDCSLVRHDPEARPVRAVIVIDLSTGTRNIFSDARSFVSRGPEEMTEVLISRCRVLFLDHRVAEAGVAAAQVAHRLGIPVLADVERLMSPEVPGMMDASDHLIVSAGLAQEVTGRDDPPRAVEALSRPDRAATVVTAGDAGCWYAEGAGPIVHQPAFTVEVVDTTGCGDVFHGAYAALLARGAEVPRCIRFAAATAALKATCHGGRSGIPVYEAVETFLREQG